MNLPLVDVFKTPYESWEYRELSLEEALVETNKNGVPTFSVKSKLIARINNHDEAARYMLQRQADNGLSAHVDNELAGSREFSEMTRAMPTVPESLLAYKHDYRSCNLQRASADIAEFGHPLHEGQVLFHGGYFPYEPSKKLITDRPLSTSFCPQVALLNSLWQGKAFEVGEVHLLVLRIISPSARAFVFPWGGDLEHENEVLLASNVELRFVTKSIVRSDFELCKYESHQNQSKKMVDAYVIEVDVVGGP